MDINALTGEKVKLISRHPQTFTSLLTLGQRGDFGSQRVDILLVPDGEGVPRQGDAAALVIGAVIGRVTANDGTFLGLAGQVAGSIADDLRLCLALGKDALPESLHGHNADFIPEYTGRRLDLERVFRGGHRRLRGRAHCGYHARLTGTDTGGQSAHSVYTNGAECCCGNGCACGGSDAGADGSRRSRPAIFRHARSQPGHSSCASGAEWVCRDRGCDRALNRGGDSRAVRREVIPGSAFTDTSGDILADRMHSLGRRLNDQRGLQCVLQIGGNALGIGFPTSRSHSLANTGGHVFTDTGKLQSVQELDDLLQIVVVLLCDFVPVLNGSNNLGHIGGDGCQCGRIEVQQHGLVEHALIGGLTANGSPELFDPVSEMKTILLPVPPREEQDQIVRYLDWQVSKINRLIAAKRKEIALLKEHRTAKINQAVTTGIHSDTQLAYTGYNWLPYAPANWKPVPAKALFRNVTELRRQDDSMLAVTQKYGLIEQTEYMRLEGRRIVLANDNLDKWLHTEPNDFIISLRSFQGGLEMCSKPGCVTWHYVVLRAQRDVSPDFYKWFFKSAAYVGALQKTSDFIRDGQDLRFSNFVKVGLFSIPMSEQCKIAEYLNREIPKYNAAIANLEEQIDLIAEYRTRLISDVVIGQMDVREIEVPEFEYVDEGDATDEQNKVETEDEEDG